MSKLTDYLREDHIFGVVVDLSNVLGAVREIEHSALRIFAGEGDHRAKLMLENYQKSIYFKSSLEYRSRECHFERDAIVLPAGEAT